MNEKRLAKIAREILPILDSELSWFERICWQWIIIAFPLCVAGFLWVAARG